MESLPRDGGRRYAGEAREERLYYVRSGGLHRVPRQGGFLSAVGADHLRPPRSRHGAARRPLLRLGEEVAESPAEVLQAGQPHEGLQGQQAHRGSGHRVHHDDDLLLAGGTDGMPRGRGQHAGSQSSSADVEQRQRPAGPYGGHLSDRQRVPDLLGPRLHPAVSQGAGHQDPLQQGVRLRGVHEHHEPLGSLGDRLLHDDPDLRFGHARRALHPQHPLRGLPRPRRGPDARRHGLRRPPRGVRADGLGGRAGRLQPHDDLSGGDIPGDHQQHEPADTPHAGHHGEQGRRRPVQPQRLRHRP
mmetsp:Transcript_73958/g.216633  ORF Transcript_73958/g.216633 Transcript_73958/m.216633 type:complete len:301 (+) Transcript_73958:706-1608(+)